MPPGPRVTTVARHRHQGDRRSQGERGERPSTRHAAAFGPPTSEIHVNSIPVVGLRKIVLPWALSRKAGASALAPIPRHLPFGEFACGVLCPAPPGGETRRGPTTSSTTNVIALSMPSLGSPAPTGSFPDRHVQRYRPGARLLLQPSARRLPAPRHCNNAERRRPAYRFQTGSMRMDSTI